MTSITTCGCLRSSHCLLILLLPAAACCCLVACSCNHPLLLLLLSPAAAGLQKGMAQGVPGLVEDKALLGMSAQRFPSKSEALWEAVKHRRTCVFIDLFNSVKLGRAVDALKLGQAEAAAAGGADKLSVGLVIDEMDGTIASPNRNQTRGEIACYQ